MTVEAKGLDGAGWYIVEIDSEDRRFLRHWERYNVREVAIANGQFKFPGERTDAMFWTGAEWERT